MGQGTGETQRIIEEQVGAPNVRVAAIGPAGENQVRFACVVNALKHTNGRGGMGAVMGSKNLKAIAVRGSRPVPFKDKDALKQMIKWYADHFMDHPIERVLHDGGTIGWDVTELDEAGILPTLNFRSGSFEKAEDICGNTFHQKYFVEAGACQACVVRCKRVARSTAPGRSTPPTAARSTRRRPRSARSAGFPTWRRSARPTSCATPTPLTPYRRG